MNKIPIPDALAAFDKTMVEIEKDFNDPDLFDQATTAELYACLDMADKIYAAVSRFKMTVGIVIKSREEDGEEQSQ